MACRLNNNLIDGSLTTFMHGSKLSTTHHPNKVCAKFRYEYFISSTQSYIYFTLVLLRRNYLVTSITIWRYCGGQLG